MYVGEILEWSILYTLQKELYTLHTIHYTLHTTHYTLHFSGPLPYLIPRGAPQTQDQYLALNLACESFYFSVLANDHGFLVNLH